MVGEVPSGLADEGVIRLKSDFLLSQDPRTACTMQNFVNKQQEMAAAFKSVSLMARAQVNHPHKYQSMAKLAVIGQDVKTLVDCSEVIPEPVVAVNKPAT